MQVALGRTFLDLQDLSSFLHGELLSVNEEKHISLSGGKLVERLR